MMYDTGCDGHIGRRPVVISSTDNLYPRIQHHVNGIGIQLGNDEGCCYVESLMRECEKEDKIEQSDSS